MDAIVTSTVQYKKANNERINCRGGGGFFGYFCYTDCTAGIFEQVKLRMFLLLPGVSEDNAYCIIFRAELCLDTD